MSTQEYLDKKFGPHTGTSYQLQNFLRDDMYKLFAELGFMKGLEVGIEKGKNAVTMYENIPNLHLIGVDPWKQHTYASYAKDAAKRDWSYERLQQWKQQTLARMKGRDYETIEAFSEEAALQVPDNSLDFVYLDADHSYDGMMLDIILWGRKIRKGGILSGHDYYPDKSENMRRSKITHAIDDYTRVHGIKFYVTSEIHKDMKGDIYPSWFWVKLDDICPNVI